MLDRNLEALPNVTVPDAAVGAEPGFVSIANDVSGWSARTLPAEDGISVATIAEAVAKVPGQQSSRNFQRAMAKYDFELFLPGENLIYVRI